MTGAHGSRYLGLISYVDGLTDDMFFIDVDDGEEFTLARSILLAQISAHGFKPPEISLWAWRMSEDGHALLAHLASES